MQKVADKTDDEYDTFGQYIANELRSISADETKARILKFKIQQCIFEAKGGFGTEYATLQSVPQSQTAHQIYPPTVSEYQY